MYIQVSFKHKQIQIDDQSSRDWRHRTTEDVTDGVSSINY